MDRATFDMILIEEGIDDVVARNAIWQKRPSDILDESKLRTVAKLYFRHDYQIYKTRKALNSAMAREYGWDK